MTHDEIRTLLTFRDAPERQCDVVNAPLDDHIGHVARRIGELKLLQRELKTLRDQCPVAQMAGACKIMQSLGRDSAVKDKTGEDHGKLNRTHT